LVRLGSSNADAVMHGLFPLSVSRDGCSRVRLR
jgi:hypothetical protein